MLVDKQDSAQRDRSTDVHKGDTVSHDIILNTPITTEYDTAYRWSHTA